MNPLRNHLFHAFFFVAVSLSFSPVSQAQNQYVDSMLRWIKVYPKEDSQYIVTLHRLSYRFSENDVEKAFQYYEKVATLSEQLNFTYGKSLAQINLGVLLFSAGDYFTANTAYFKAIELAELCNAQRLKAISLNNIGENFRALRDYDKCREYTQQAIVKNKELQAWRGVAINYELLQQCDMKESNYDEAYNNLVMGMPYATRAAEGYILSLYYIGFGKLKAVANQLDSADYFFAKGLEISRREGDKRNEYHHYLARAEYMPNLSDQAKMQLLKSAYDIARDTKYTEGIIHVTNQLSALYDKTGNKDSSMYYFNIFRSGYDSIFSERTRRSVIVKEADWRIERQDLENRHLKELAEVQESELAIKNYLLAGSIVLLLLSTGIAFVIHKNIQVGKKNAEADFRQKMAESKMQALRAQMNPHFLFNSLNSIENFIMKNEKWAASSYLNKFSSLIRMILESSRLERIPFRKDFEAIKLYVELEQLRFNNKFQVNTQIAEELMNVNYSVPPLLIQPLVENAILHGLSHSESPLPELQLIVILAKDYIIYTIEDNGIGRKKSNSLYHRNKIVKHGSMGLKVIEERIQILNLQQKNQASMHVTDLYDETGKSAGTRVQIKLKVF